MYGIKIKGNLFHYECAVCGCSRTYLQQKKSGGGRRRRYCSSECRNEGGRRMREALAIVIVTKCQICETEFADRVSGGPQLYCSKKCAIRARTIRPETKENIKRWMKRNPEKRKEWRSTSNHRRRAAKSAVIETISPTAVFVRDKWKCQLCRCTVEPTLAKYNPKGATLDHIVPLSRGGSHTWANVQTACSLCNSKKNAKTIGQFRLF
jgi:5-methylcytosine-specific restriction endonuclease McrA